MPRRPSALRVAAKYKDKKEVPKSDGKGTTTVYEYGPRQVAKRHKDKAVRIEALRKKMADLRQKARGDLTASDPETRLTALAVCLMDETYERVGNEQSAKDGHYGVTNWTADHITLSDKAATIKYTGKSGVKHEKKVTNARVLSALRKALKGKGKGDKVLCDGDECSILAKDVNAYLKPYGITAKDIRGLHANEEMKHHLKAQRKAGPADLPRSRKERDEILKAEFQAALDLAAAAVGHEPSTLRSQYLVPNMEDAYIHDGTVLDRLDKKASSLDGFLDGFFRRHPKLSKYRRLIRFRGREQGSSSGHGEARQHGDEVWVFPKFWTHQQGVQDFVLAHEIGHWVKSNNAFGSAFMDAARSVGVDPWDTPNLPFGQFNMDEAFADSFASYYTDGDVKRRYPEWARLVEVVISGGRTATLSDSEKEDREDEAQVRQSPKLKPPRTDKERRMVKDRDNSEDDPDARQDRKDRSTNYKDAAARVALRYLLAQDGEGEEDGSSGKGGVSGKFLQFMEEEGDSEVKNPDTGNTVKLKSLKGDKGRKVQQQEFQKWLNDQGDGETPGTPRETDTPKDKSPSKGNDSPLSSDEYARADRIAEARDKRDKLMREDEALWDMGEIVAAIKEEYSSIPGIDPKMVNATLSTKSEERDKRRRISYMIESLNNIDPKAIKTFDKRVKDARKSVLDSVETMVGSSRQISDLPTSTLMELAPLLAKHDQQIARSLMDPKNRSQAAAKAENADKVLEKASDEKETTPPVDQIAAAIRDKRFKMLADNPDMLNPTRPLSKLSLDPIGKSVRESDFRNKMADRSVEAMQSYLDMDSESRSTHRRGLEDRLKEMEADGHQDSEQYHATTAQLRGLAFASAMEDGDDAKGVNPTFQKSLMYARKQGRLDEFARLNLGGATDGDEPAQVQIRKVVESVPVEDLGEMLPDGHPGKEMIEALNNETFTATMDAESQDLLRRIADDMILSEMVFTDMDLVKKGKSVGKIKGERKPDISKWRSSWDDLLKQLGITTGKTASHLPLRWDFGAWGDVLSHRLVTFSIPTLNE